jgi:hypothetical protein
MFQNIPHEMRVWPQFVVWRYEETEGPKPTKVPYSPRNLRHASVNDPSTWATFDEAVAAANNNNGYAGIGFVLTEADPYAFVDLDNPYETKEDGSYKHANPDEIMQRQLHIYNEFNSFSEYSPSGKGLHIICKGSLESGRKRSSIEVYSSQRFMTMTGNIYNNAPIVEQHELLNALHKQMGEGKNAQAFYAGLEHAKLTDEQVLEMAGTAANGPKFTDLYYAGDWGKYYPSQSEADLALVDIIAFYSENRQQVQKLFLSSKLGQREKSRAQYRINYMLAKCFDRMLPPVDIDGLRNQVNEAVEKRQRQDAEKARAKKPTVKHEQAEASPEPSNSIYSVPPGLVGEIAKFIYAQAPRPVAEIALAGALGLVAGIVGRAYNISGTGLNQYVLLLAPTGTGKEAIASGIDKLIAQVIRAVPAASEFIGPAEISSSQALTKYMSKTAASFVSLIGEFGLMMQQMCAPHAPPHLLGLRRMLLDLYNKSGEGKVMRPTIYSDREKNTSAILAPSFTVLGESTPERFYEALNEDMISEGLLPRFTVIEYKGNQPPLNKDASFARPSFEVIERLSTLCAHALMLNSQHKAINVGFAQGVESEANAFEEFCRANNNGADRDLKKQFWTRAHMKALKLASLIAVGCNPYEPMITTEIFAWATTIIVADIRNFLGRFDAGDVGSDNDEQKQLNEVVRVVRDYVVKPWSEVQKYSTSPIGLHSERIIPFSYVSRRLAALSVFRKDRRGSGKAMELAIKTLCDRGDLQEVSRATLAKDHNTTAKCYMISTPKVFGL